MTRSVLVVDDSVTAAAQLKKLLEDTGEFRVVAHAANGEEAERLYFEHKPDLVTMDIVMPGRDGLETIKQIIARDAGAKIVVVSSMGGVKSKVVAALSAGARNVIPKPFDKEKVLLILRQLK